MNPKAEYAKYIKEVRRLKALAEKAKQGKRGVGNLEVEYMLLLVELKAQDHNIWGSRYGSFKKLLQSEGFCSIEAFSRFEYGMRRLSIKEMELLGVPLMHKIFSAYPVQRRGQVVKDLRAWLDIQTKEPTRNAVAIWVLNWFAKMETLSRKCQTKTAPKALRVPKIPKGFAGGLLDRTGRILCWDEALVIAVRASGSTRVTTKEIMGLFSRQGWSVQSKAVQGTIYRRLQEHPEFRRCSPKGAPKVMFRYLGSDWCRGELWDKTSTVRSSNSSKS